MSPNTEVRVRKYTAYAAWANLAGLLVVVGYLLVR